MRREKFNGHTLMLFDSIESLPPERFEMFNKYFMLDSGIGGDIGSIDDHINKIRVFNKKGKVDDVEQALLNMRLNMVFTMKKINPKMYCFYALLSEINGRKIKSISKESIDELKEELMKTGITMGKITGIIIDVKKNLMKKLSWCFRRSRAV